MSRYDGARGADGLRQEDWGTRIGPRGTGGLRVGDWVGRGEVGSEPRGPVGQGKKDTVKLEQGDRPMGEQANWISGSK